MKNLKKIIACSLAVTTLGCVSLTPIGINALLQYTDTSNNEPFIGYDEYMKECEENSIKEALFIVEDGDILILTTLIAIMLQVE